MRTGVKFASPGVAARDRATAPATPAPPIVGGGLVSRNAPPLRLPGEYFTAALGFWLLGSAGLVWVAPDIARGDFALPRVVVVTHLFTLGWITTTIMGALCQFLPVALGASIRSQRMAHWSFALHVPGLLLFLGGMLSASTPVLLLGATLFGTALLLFAGNLAATLSTAIRKDLTWWALSVATTSLIVTVVLGASLSGNLAYGYLGADRLLAIGVHLHIAIAGWVLPVIVGVAHRLLPMFLLSHGAPEWPGRLAAGLLAAGVGLLLAIHHFLAPWTVGVIGTLLAAGVAAFLAQALLFFRHRKKPRLDPGLRLVVLALGFLASALLLGPLFLAQGPAAPHIATGYVLALLGAISLFIAGHYYKIVPFLIWFHRFGPLVGKRPVPSVSELYDPRPGNAAAGLLAAGTFGLLVSTISTTAGAARPAAALFAIGGVIVAAQMFDISRSKPQ